DGRVGPIAEVAPIRSCGRKPLKPSLPSNRTKLLAKPPASPTGSFRPVSISKRPAPMTREPRVSAVEPTDCRRSGGLQQTELRERGDAVVQADFLDDLAVLETQHRRSGEAHLEAGGGWQGAD